MKRSILIMILAILLPGCKAESTELERGMELRSKILRGKQVSFITDIVADYGDSVQLFSMDCLFDDQGNLSFTVAAPDTIAGITGTISQGQGRLTFNETALYIPVLTDEQINPVSAPWILMKTLRSGYLSSAGMEEDQLRLTIHDSYEENALVLDIWMNEDELPRNVEISYTGKNILTLTVRDFEIM